MFWNDSFISVGTVQRAVLGIYRELFSFSIKIISVYLEMLVYAYIRYNVQFVSQILTHLARSWKFLVNMNVWKCKVGVSLWMFSMCISTFGICMHMFCMCDSCICFLYDISELECLICLKNWVWKCLLYVWTCFVNMCKCSVYVFKLMVSISIDMFYLSGDCLEYVYNFISICLNV